MSPSDARPVPPFPLGVVDPESDLACIAAGCAIHAVNLETGKRVWRSTAARAVFGIGHESVLAINEDEPNVLAFVILNETTGSVRAYATPVELPFWLEVNSRSFFWQTLTAPTHFVFRWRARRDYSGGAPISDESARREGFGAWAHGALHIDVTSGEVRETDITSDTLKDIGIPDTSIMPAVIGTRVYRLAIRSGTRVLEAQTADGKLLWTYTLARTSDAPPLRE